MTTQTDIQYSVGGAVAKALKNGTGLLLSRLAFIAMPFLFTAAVFLGREVVTLYMDKIVTAQQQQLEMLKDMKGTVKDVYGRTTQLEATVASHGATLVGIKERMDDQRRTR